MTDVVNPSKRPRAPSLAENDFDWLFQEKKGMKDDDKLISFLELCGLCKKKLRHDEEVYMYGYFGAFCSKACREKQMAYDIFIEKSREAAKTKKGRTCAGIKPKEDEPFVNGEKISSPPRFYICC